MKKKIFTSIILTVLLVLNLNAVQAAAQENPPFQVKVTGKGQPMIFIPGATCSGEEWKETVQHFSKSYECHVFTLAGYAGVTPLKGNVFLENFKNGIINYVKEKQLENVVLVGHSIGGFLSLWTASELQERLQKVVVVDAMPFYAGALNPLAKPGFNDAQAKALLTNYEQMNNEQLKAFQLNTTRTLCADSTYWDRIATWGSMSDRKTMAYTITEMMGNDLREQIANIKVPVLVMAAYMAVEQYPMFTKEYAEGTFKQQYAKCGTCEIRMSPPAKHFVMYDAPEWFLKEIDNFIAEK